jgi:adenosylhomocysteinase
MEPRSTRAAAEVARMNTFFPLMPLLGTRWAKQRPFQGMRVAVNAHLTTLTAALLRELTLGGGEWVVSAANPATTDLDVVALLREEGVEVHTGGDMVNPHLAALESRPHLIADVGFDLLDTLVRRRPDLAEGLIGAVEITRTGINRLRDVDVPFGVVNINDGKLKGHVENRHGVGAGLWPSVTQVTGLQVSGRRVLVIGYGPVGQGIAAYAKALGAVVAVIERDPVQSLIAHYDGYSTAPLEEALSRAEIIVTATGVPNALTLEQLRHAKSGAVLVNAGHGGDEIAVKALREQAESADELGPRCVRLKLPKGPWLTVLGGGHPLNIVMNAGSPEPVLLHFAVLGLTLEWIVKQGRLSPGEMTVPGPIEAEAARLALQALKG